MVDVQESKQEGAYLTLPELIANMQASAPATTVKGRYWRSGAEYRPPEEDTPTDGDLGII
jgi:hypothetical protein